MRHRGHTPNFDEARALYERNPAAFETWRAEVLNDFIRAAPAQHQPELQRTLRRIEAARTAAATPFEALATAFAMMSESVQQLHDAWNKQRFAVAALQTAVLIERARAH
jgi:hypothetical protein